MAVGQGVPGLGGKAYWWTKSDLAQAEELLRAERTDDVDRFAEHAREADLAGGSPHSADVFVLLFAVTAAAGKLGRRRSAPRDDDYWDGLATLPDIDAELVARIREFAIDSKSLERVRDNTLPGPPRDIADMYTMSICCNFALDASVMRARYSSTWDRRFRLLARSFRRKRLGVPASYRTP